MLSTQEKRINAKIYKWEDYEMGKKDKRDKSESETAKKMNSDNIGKLFFPISTLACSIFAIGISVFTLKANETSALASLTTSMDNIKEDISDMKDDMKEINDKVNNLDTRLTVVESRLTTLESHLTTVESRLTTVESYVNAKSLSGSININDIVDIQQNDSTITTAPIDSNAVIGTDSDGKAYIADELINQTIILTYNDEGKEVYFLGQYDENYRWNGYCVTNAYYPDGTLYGICESNFDDGTRLDYKSFVATDTPNEWVYSDKICSEESNAGKNILYSLVYDRTKNFTITNVRTTDIMYPDDFVNQNNPRVLKYYNGNTVNGKYEDNTGNAYYISFNEDGTIKTLYVGQFSNGTFNDNTGEAWDISYSEESRNYIYNKGIFKDGNATNCTSEIYNMNQINALIANRDFDCELKWKE